MQRGGQARALLSPYSLLTCPSSKRRLPYSTAATLSTPSRFKAFLRTEPDCRTLEVLGEDATVLHGYDVGIPSPSIGIQTEPCMPQRYASSASSTASTRAYRIGIGSKREAAKHGRSPLNTQPRPSTARDFSATRLLEHGIEQCGPSLAASGVSRSFKNSCQFGL